MDPIQRRETCGVPESAAAAFSSAVDCRGALLWLPRLRRERLFRRDLESSVSRVAGLSLHAEHLVLVPHVVEDVETTPSNASGLSPGHGPLVGLPHAVRNENVQFGFSPIRGE